MSRFSEGMIEDGFSDPMEYMDHLELEADDWSSKMDNHYDDDENDNDADEEEDKDDEEDEDE